MLENKCPNCGRDLDSGFNCPVCSKKPIGTELKVKLEDKEQLVKKIAQKVFLTDEGKKMFGHILLACGTNRHSFIPGDPYATAFHCGQQSIGFWLISLIEDKWEMKEKQEELEKRVEKMCKDNPGTEDWIAFYRAINSLK